MKIAVSRINHPAAERGAGVPKSYNAKPFAISATSVRFRALSFFMMLRT
jgi:hypothetical protein